MVINLELWMIALVKMNGDGYSYRSNLTTLLSHDHLPKDCRSNLTTLLSHDHLPKDEASWQSATQRWGILIALVELNEVSQAYCQV